MLYSTKGSLLGFKILDDSSMNNGVLVLPFMFAFIKLPSLKRNTSCIAAIGL